MFNVSLSVEKVVQETDIFLTPDWDRLKISQDQFSVREDQTVELNMTANHFYLYHIDRKYLILCHREDQEVRPKQD